MKVLILGSGVIGTSLAYYLTKAGHEVTVVDRQAGPGLETSYANAGEVSPGYAAPWAAPGIPLKALKWAFMRYRPLVIWPLPDPAMWRWGLAMLMNCTASRYEINKGRMVRLAEYSRDCLRDHDEAHTLLRRCPSCGSPRLLRHAERDSLHLAHIDCDAFYAAIEKRDDPSLLDKPVIVGGGKRGVVSTCCYIARMSGVRSAMPMFQALKACPEAVVVKPDMADLLPNLVSALDEPVADSSFLLTYLVARLARHRLEGT